MTNLPGSVAEFWHQQLPEDRQPRHGSCCGRNGPPHNRATPRAQATPATRPWLAEPWGPRPRVLAQRGATGQMWGIPLWSPAAGVSSYTGHSHPRDPSQSFGGKPVAAEPVMGLDLPASTLLSTHRAQGAPRSGRFLTLKTTSDPSWPRTWRQGSLCSPGGLKLPVILMSQPP